MLALFRAQGGRILHNQSEKSSIKSKKISIKNEKLVDIFDPVNYQRLPVMFYSFCPESNNAPSFCVEPRFVYFFFTSHIIRIQIKLNFTFFLDWYLWNSMELMIYAWVDF